MHYSVADHLHMIRDTARVSAYSEALRRLITPESVVIDIGSGIGTFALLACKYGARRVYAIEPAELIQVGRELAEANGFGDRIQFIQSMSTDVDLPERADLVVSDLRGSCPFFQSHIPSIIDARSRFLKPDGQLLPCADRILAVALQAPDIARTQIPFESWSFENLDLSLVRDYVSNVPFSTQRKPERSLTDIVALGEVDYRDVASTDFTGSMSMSISHDGRMHGIGLWFETTLAPSIGFSTAMRVDDFCVYGTFFLPWMEPVEVSQGEVLDLTVSATLVHHEYVWEWGAAIRGAPGTATTRILAQNSLLGIPVSLETARRRAGDQAPMANGRGRAIAFVLNQMKGTDTVDSIAHVLLQHYPEQFRSLAEAFELVGDVAAKYGA